MQVRRRRLLASPNVVNDIDLVRAAILEVLVDGERAASADGHIFGFDVSRKGVRQKASRAGGVQHLDEGITKRCEYWALGGPLAEHGSLDLGGRPVLFLVFGALSVFIEGRSRFAAYVARAASTSDDRHDVALGERCAYCGVAGPANFESSLCEALNEQWLLCRG